MPTTLFLALFIRVNCELACADSVVLCVCTVPEDYTSDFVYTHDLTFLSLAMTLRIHKAAFNVFPVVLVGGHKQLLPESALPIPTFA